MNNNNNRSNSHQELQKARTMDARMGVERKEETKMRRKQFQQSAGIGMGTSVYK